MLCKIILFIIKLYFIILSVPFKTLKQNLIYNYSLLCHFFLQARSFIEKIIKKTGIICDDQFSNHLCIWDPNYPENPQRVESIIKR